jgi:hypothetical protein
MKIFFRYIAMLFFALSITSGAFAETISIPAPAFYSGPDGHGRPNLSGTAQHFNTILFAPISLPEDVTITSFECGGRAFFKRSIKFTLRRNEPQQQNIDVASMRTTLDGTGFEVVRTSTINSGVINNERFNYYIVAEIKDPSVNPPTRPFCPNKPSSTSTKVPECSVGFCEIRFDRKRKPVFER